MKTHLSSTIAALLGETTTSASMPSIPVALKATRPRRIRRAQVKEDDEDRPVIPDGAKPYHTGKQGVNSAGAAEDSQHLGTEGASGAAEDYIETSVALVAPDTTPGSEEPLDSSQVPGGKSATQAPQTTAAAPDSPPEGDVMRTLIGVHHSKIPAPTSVDTGTDSEVKAESIDPTAVAAAMITESVRASSIAAELTSGKAMPPPKHNPEAARKACEAMRMFTT
jgi:hypothetical protein